MSLHQKIILAILSLTILFLVIEISNGADQECDDVLEVCIKSIEIKKQVIAQQTKVIDTQSKIIEIKEKEIVKTKEGQETRDVWSVIATSALFLLLL